MDFVLGSVADVQMFSFCFINDALQFVIPYDVAVFVSLLESKQFFGIMAVKCVKKLIRQSAFQVVEDGYEFFAKRQLVTLFSAPNYCGEFDNAGAMMSVDETLMCSFQVHFLIITALVDISGQGEV